MYTELQFLAVGAFLLWGLASALCEMFLPGSPPDSEIRIVDSSHRDLQSDRLAVHQDVDGARQISGAREISGRSGR